MADIPMVRIVAVPAGEAPLDVRECWVGLELPLARRNLVVAKTFGVVSGPRTRLGIKFAEMLGRGRDLRGYAVRSADALVILRAAHPEAAAWWGKHAPQYFRPGRCFLFREIECQPVASRV